MGSNSNQNEDSNLGSSTGDANLAIPVMDQPLQLDKPVEVPFEGIDVHGINAQIKVTPLSNGRTYTPGDTIGMYWENLPHRENALEEPRIQTILKEKVESYQEKHPNDAFYEIWSDLTRRVLKKNEAFPSHSELRYNHEEYDMRLSNRACHYRDAVLQYLGSVQNLCVLAKLNSKGAYKTFGYACRISVVNTRANIMNRLPIPKGIKEHFSKYAHFAVTKSDTSNSNFVAFPWIRMSPTGNVGQHAIGFDSSYASVSQTGDVLVSQSDQGADNDSLTGLVHNMSNVLAKFVYNSKDTNGKHIDYLGNLIDNQGKYNVGWSDPFVENGATLTTKGTDGKIINISLNADGSQFFHGKYAYKKDENYNSYAVQTDNIINRAWANLEMSTAYISTYFPDALQEGSQFRDFLCDILGEYELDPKYDASEMFNKTNLDMYWDAYELMDKNMRYKANNEVNTATIVKWMPIMDEAGDAPAFNNDDYFDINFRRYDPNHKSTYEYLKSVEDKPRLTPTVFNQVDNYAEDEMAGSDLPPYVANAVSSASTEIDSRLHDDSDTVSVPSKAIYGKYATMFDIMCTSSTDPRYNEAITLALNKDYIQKYIENNNGRIIANYNSPLIYEQPIFDNTDIMQCGFNVIISNDAVAPSEIDQWYTQIQNYLHAKDDDSPAGSYAVPEALCMESGAITTQPSMYATDVEIGDEQYVLAEVAHTAHPVYRDYMKHCVIFIGDKITSHPMMAGSKVTAGLPVATLYGSKDSESSVKGYLLLLKSVSQAITSADVTNQNADDILEQFVCEAIAASRQFNYVAADSDMGTGINTALQRFQYMMDQISTPDDVNPRDNMIEVNTFNPSYGLVSPATMPVLSMVEHCYSPEVVGQFSLDNEKLSNNFDSAAAVIPAIGPYLVGSNDFVDYSPDLYNQPLPFSVRKTVAQFWVYFIEQFTFARVIYDKFGNTISPEKGFKSILCSMLAKSRLALFSRLKVSFAGAGDSVPDLYDSDNFKSTFTFVEPAASAIKFVSGVAAPYVKFSRVSGKRNDKQYESHRTVSNAQTYSAAALSKVTGSNNNNNNKAGGRNYGKDDGVSRGSGNKKTYNKDQDKGKERFNKGRTDFTKPEVGYTGANSTQDKDVPPMSGQYGSSDNGVDDKNKTENK